MLQPKKQKYRKAHRGVLKGKATRGAHLAFGDVGLKAMTTGILTARQIEAARKTIAGSLKRWGKVWIRIFPHKPYTKKALEVPMGGGKGSVEWYIAPVRAGTILFEIAGIGEESAREALQLASYKLPVKTKIITHNR